MNKAFDFLKKNFPSTYRDIVLEHKAVNKVITFCDDKNQYLLFTGMFPEVNEGKGIYGELEGYFVNFLADKYNATAFARASAYALEDQTSFIGIDIKSIDNDIWSQQNIFHTDNESKVTDVEEKYTNSSKKNVICPAVNTYFEKIPFPEDTQEFLNNLYEQVKPSLQLIQLKK
ncbi:hypothetical protein OAL85_00015 [Methylophilaceae bacterium]|jgi:hypothetical protein|nr:hypothetical protein [Methylophilaceae bacterium]